MIQPDLADQPGEPRPRIQPGRRMPRSSSITSTLDGGQPSSTARAVNPYCNRVDSP
jgi:hypothetical protein